jgi:hypothetical protein
VAHASIPNDCSVDVTAHVNALIAATPDGSTLTLDRGCYLTNDTVVIRDKRNFVFDGDGATFKRTGNGAVSNDDHVAVLSGRHGRRAGRR